MRVCSFAVVLFVVFSQRGQQKGVHRTRPCAPSPLVFPPLVFLCLFVCSSWCDGSVCVWEMQTNHCLLNDWALMMHRRLHFVKGTFQSWLLCGGRFAAFGCAVTVTLQVSYRGSALVNWCAPLSTVYLVLVAGHRSRPSDSAGISRVYVWASLRTTRCSHSRLGTGWLGARSDSVLVTTTDPRLKLSVLDRRWTLISLVLRRPKFWRCTHTASSCEEPSLSQL